MHILILGSGGREHAFAHAISKSPKCEQLFVAPGNAGTAAIASRVAIEVSDFEKLKDFVVQNKIQMLVVGPEGPLVAGIRDYFEAQRDQNELLSDLLVIGPNKKAALLEGSKDFAKQFMAQQHIPTAQYQSFTAENLAEGKRFLEQIPAPYVLKADGLAAGKGVLILESLEEAKYELEQMLLHQKFGDASKKVVIEAFLDGIELSVFVLTDGKNYLTLPTAKDYKRIGVGDTGLNTGGMGAISPVPFADAAFMEKVDKRIIKPTIQGVSDLGTGYQGFIFIGLIKVDDEPFVIEYNIRMGDPETEVVFPRIKTDWVDLFTHIGTQTLDAVTLDIDQRAAATVMLVSGGYPQAYAKDKIIQGLDQVSKETLVFHAGTKRVDGEIQTNGGRVLAVTALDVDYQKALDKSYAEIQKIKFENSYYRKDIGWDLKKIEI